MNPGASSRSMGCSGPWVRRNRDSLDPKIHHNNLLTSILAKIEANVAGADDAVMLDSRGFIAETNATHLFMVFPGDSP